MFATNITTLDTQTRFTRGEDDLTIFSQSQTVLAGSQMTNAFCKTCGAIMYRAGSGEAGTRYMRMGPVDDHNLLEKVLKPDCEQSVEHVKGIIGFSKQD